ncbi:MAG: zinc ABC transporter substrate-binding protein [Methylovirgula sp.]
MAKQIGGDDVSVTSILSNPDEDPHLFEASPSVARAISGAKIVIASGADYDPWVQKLLSASNSADRKSIVVADLVGKKSGDNPHIWYDIRIMTAFAKAFAADLARDRPVAQGGLRQAPGAIRGLIAADPHQDRDAPSPARRPCCYGNGTRFWLYARCAGPHQPQSGVPDRGHEQHGAERLRRCRLRGRSKKPQSGHVSI